MEYKKTLFFFILLLAMPIAFGKALETSIELKFASVGKTVVINNRGGVCAFSGKHGYKLNTNKEQTQHELVCKVHNSDFNFDSKIQLELTQNFQFPNTILVDMKDWPGATKQDIVSSKNSWGIEYTWSTPSKGSTKYHYLCPANTNYCVRVKVNGSDELTFSFRQ